MLDTRYLETDALVCAMERYEKGAKEKLRELTPSERRRLQEALGRLDNRIDDVMQEEREKGKNNTCNSLRS